MADKALDVHVDLKQVSAQLRGTERAFANSTRRNIRAAMSASGADVSARARANASWSTRIPSAIVVKTFFSQSRARVEMVANARQAPHARPLEVGSQGGGGVNRHPVFGTATRVDQPVRPFFFPAAAAASPAAQHRMEAALDTIARDAGFH